MTFKKYSLLIFGICLLTNMDAQGLLIDDTSDSRYEALPRLPDFNDGGKTSDKVLEGITGSSLKAYCPRPRHQGQTGACVGWAVGYGALTIQQAIANEWKGQTDLITKNAFSPLFIYNQIKISDCLNGAYMEAAMTLLQTKGDLLAADFDENRTDCTVMPTKKQLGLAAQNKIENYQTLFSTKAPAQAKLTAIKLSLIQNRPVVVGMNLLNNFQYVHKKSQYWNPAIGDRGNYGGHALVVIGFDDGRGAFEVMNSWGEEWGNQGFGWIKYEDFVKYVRYGFQMSLQEKKEYEKQYAGKFSLRRFEAMMTSGQALFSEVPVELKSGIYRLKEQKVTTGTVFQLSVSQTSPNTYIYALGIEPNGQIKTYWPTAKQDALLPYSENDLYIPSADAGLQFKQVGMEQLVILFAKQPIPNITNLMNSFKNEKIRTIESLQAILGKNAPHPSTINYEKTAMEFLSEQTEKGIISIVLELEISE